MSFGVSISITVSGKNFADHNWVDEVSRAMERTTKPKLKKLFLKSTFGWSPENVPDFDGKLNRKANFISMQVFPRNNQRGQVYRMVVLGAPRHPIPKNTRKGKLLKFRKGYIAATKPGRLMSGHAYRNGPTVVARKVNHPGFEPREFDVLVAEAYVPEFQKDMQEAFDKAASRG